MERETVELILTSLSGDQLKKVLRLILVTKPENRNKVIQEVLKPHLNTILSKL